MTVTVNSVYPLHLFRTGTVTAIYPINFLSASYRLPCHVSENQEGAQLVCSFKLYSGSDLLSRDVPVPSALEGLTAVFGMGTGVAPPL